MTQTLPARSRPRRRDLLRQSAWFSRETAAQARYAPSSGAGDPDAPGAMRLPGRPRHEEDWSKATAAGRPQSVAASQSIAGFVTPPAAVIAFHRLAFGPRPGDLAAFDALAATDAQRLAIWVDQQLSPAAINDSACTTRLNQSGFTTLNKSLVQLWSQHENAPEGTPWKERQRPYYETVLATFIRAIHSRRQLFEVLVDFWHNHFNVYADAGGGVGSTWVHSDRDAIRAHALGNFRQMLEAVAKTPAMLVYLDNFVNSNDGLNENYPRELLELHGVGAENYFGNIAPAAVPRDGNNVPLGYCDADVTEVAKCLTGWTFRNRSWDPDFGDTGEFFTYEEWHTPGNKTVLGQTFDLGNALADGQRALDLIASNPGTARFIARKLARRLLGDFPPQPVVDAAAAVFAANVAAPNQIALTVRTIVTHPSFLTTWGDKVKRPFEVAVAALRAVGGDFPFRFNEDPEDWIYVDGDGSFFWNYNQCGQPLFGWNPPNGYPDVKHAWKATSPRVQMWRLANSLIQIDDDNGVLYVDPVAATPGGVRSAQALADFWVSRIVGTPMPASEHQEIVEMMAAGYNPSFDLPLDNDEDTQERLRAMVALIWMSPAALVK